MNSLTTVEAGRMIDSLRIDLEPLIIDTGKSFDRLRSVFMIAVQQNPDILKCSETSIKREISKCAADGLVPDNKEAAMIPYKGELQYQPMVLGIIKRMKELGGVFNIVCNLVFEKDEFILNEADPDSLAHKSDPFSKDRGKVVGGYVIFRDDNKRLMHLETMSMEDFERVRKASKAPDSPAWKNWTNEMYRKAVLRRGAKYISINNDKIRALLERQDEMFDFSERRTAERANPFTGEIIEGSATSVVEQQQTQQREERREEPRQQRNEGRDEGQGQRQQRNAQAGTGGGKVDTKQDAKPKEDKLPDLPDLLISKQDHPKALEAAEKILAIALDTSIAPPDRRGVLKVAAENWKDIAEHLRPLVRAFIDATDWAIKKEVAGEPWAADHAVFVHKVKSMLEVERLNIGKYP